MNNKILKWIVIIYVVATVMFAVILKLIHFNLTYAEWYNFLACFFGGTIGGIATLIAVVLSIGETRKMQQENNTIQITNNKKVFTDEIARLIAKYITDIDAYFYSQMFRDRSGVPSPNRISSVEIYYLLHIKLDSVNIAEEMLSKLDEIHNNYCFYENENSGETIHQQTELLRTLTIEFIRRYKDES